MKFVSSSSNFLSTAVLLVLPALLAVAQAADETPITPSYVYDMYRNNLPTCFDYRQAFDIGKKECKWQTLWNGIRAAYDEQAKEDWALKWHCHGGVHREVMTLIGVETHDEIAPALEAICAAALGHVAKDEVKHNVNWNPIKNAEVDLYDYFEGGTFLNTELGNLQQSSYEMSRHGGDDRYYYTGEDPRLNDYFPTTEQSYQGGIAIDEFYNKTVDRFLKAPPSSFQNYQCDKTNTAMCCWSGDRQYNDNNGRCSLGNCINKSPGDNTDLCWTEDDDNIFPYPNGEKERDTHCHGFSWSALPQEYGDVNNDAKWNNLYHVSLYDHLYKRGYTGSLTDAPDFSREGSAEQAMCGCVEDMNPVARADCTEAIGLANFTMAQNPENGRLELHYVPATFEIDYQACQGWEYNTDMTPETYQAADNVWSLGLHHKSNDLSAFVYKQYLEGKTDTDHTNEYAQTVVGYTHPLVNKNDEEREKVCQQAFATKYPGRPWELEEKCKQVKGAPVMEQGYCVTADNQDQNVGVTKLNKKNGSTCEDFAECLALCQATEGATGCEVNWNNGNIGCDVHTEVIEKGNGHTTSMCWVF